MTPDDLLEEVRSNIDRPHGLVTFTPSLEAHYREATAAGRKRSALITGAIGLAIHQLFTVVLLVTQPIEFIHSKLAIFAAIDAFVLLVLAVIALLRDHRHRDVVLIGGLILVSALVNVSYYCDDTDMAYYGMMCYIFVPVVVNSMLRLFFRRALLVSAVAFALFVVTILVKPGAPLHVQLVAMLLVFGCSAMTLWGNYRNDRDERLAFLYLTRERLLADVSRRQAEVLRELTTIDPLTSIANRRGFEERFDPLLTRCRHERRPVAVLMIDIDHFKAFNDRYGHMRGDACLRSVAQTLAGQLRSPDDLIARMGGEEFAIVAPGLQDGELVGFLERIRAAVVRLAIPHAGAGQGSPGHVTISIGCAVAHPGRDDGWGAVVQWADWALYAAKRAGRNRWQVAEETADAIA
jgi:diguanylate cyclase (GGDEF)-like protein